ncbi:hypothetical protein CALVIDRAFT_600034 [Calocera viscosa TUFC12733]|uniref:Uncharacterized protein n=1 Tax=Calocera viscosa (strain TUFC12733) TaxID=1330018 RepID=A0A167K8Q6_CALVF|nr:hypothetical protein CALVIDRAFT_600034 [Calocera viscosa TUFC12733]
MVGNDVAALFPPLNEFPTEYHDFGSNLRELARQEVAQFARELGLRLSVPALPSTASDLPSLAAYYRIVGVLY